jgi:NADPH-ferrihemoprotein reductase
LNHLLAQGDDQQVVFFYGSQTGTGEDLANRMAKEITANLEIQSLVCDPEEYDMSEMEKWPADKKWLVGFFLATYGEGEPTDNAVEFFEWIMGGKVQVADVLAKLDEPDDDEETSGQPLSNVTFIMFGLGNKTYEHFNGMARLVDKRFLRWGGATRIGERGEGDDDGRWVAAKSSSTLAKANLTFLCPL